MTVYPSMSFLPKPKDKELLYSLVKEGLRFGRKYDEFFYCVAVPHNWRLVFRTEFADSLLFCLCDEIGRVLANIIGNWGENCFCVMGNCDKEIINFEKYYFENGIWKGREQNPLLQQFQKALNEYYSKINFDNYNKLVAIHRQLPVYRELPYPPDFKIEPASYYESDEFLPLFW